MRERRGSRLDYATDLERELTGDDDRFAYRAAPQRGVPGARGVILTEAEWQAHQARTQTKSARIKQIARNSRTRRKGKCPPVTLAPVKGLEEKS